MEIVASTWTFKRVFISPAASPPIPILQLIFSCIPAVAGDLGFYSCLLQISANLDVRAMCELPATSQGGFHPRLCSAPPLFLLMCSRAPACGEDCRLQVSCDNAGHWPHGCPQNRALSLGHSCRRCCLSMSCFKHVSCIASKQQLPFLSFFF